MAAQTRTDYFIARIDDLERYRGELGRRLRDELKDLTDDVLEYVRTIGVVTIVGRKLELLTAIDVNSLVSSVELIRGRALGGPLVLSSERTLDPGSLASELERDVTEFASGQSGLHGTARAFWIDMTLEARFGEVLLCAANANTDLQDLVRLARTKLGDLGEQDVATIWGHINAEFDPSRFYTMADPAALLPSQFFRTTSTDEIRDRIAEYLVVLKPRLILAMIRTGATTIPASRFGLPRILTLASGSVAQPLSPEEGATYRSLRQIYRALSDRYRTKQNEFAIAVGVDPSSPIVAAFEPFGPEAEVVTDELVAPVLLLSLRGLLSAVDVLVKYESPLERALLQFKLGLELMAPENLRELAKKNELRLQKDLCKFLVERGMFAIGTRFGRSETDLFADLPRETFVIEAKLFRRGTNPTPGTIKRAVVQLQSYLDQPPSKPRGVLVLFNLSPTFVQSPRTWMAHRFWIVAINLQQEAPSKRTKSLSIEDGVEGELISVIGVDTRSRLLQKKRRKRKATKGPK